jgi:hypothetical protein
MSLRWKRMSHWKNIRKLVDGPTIHAFIQRGRRPNEYTLVFPDNAWTHNVLRRADIVNRIPDYVLKDSTLATAKALGMLIVKTQGELK